MLNIFFVSRIENLIPESKLRFQNRNFLFKLLLYFKFGALFPGSKLCFKNRRLFSGFSYQGFLSQTLTMGRAAGEVRSSYFFLSTSTRSQIFKHLFTTLHARWPPRIFNRYKTAIRWYLPPRGNTIWLIDYRMLICYCSFDVVILGFYYRNLTEKSGGFELASIPTLEN